MIWTVIQFGVWMLAIILLGVTSGFSIVFYGVVWVLALIALTQVRFYMRQKYSIPADCCADSWCLNDCLCTWCCSCCGVIQMMRHTHDEREYWYNCTSQTGLNEDAPEIDWEWGRFVCLTRCDSDRNLIVIGIRILSGYVHYSSFSAILSLDHLLSFSSSLISFSSSLTFGQVFKARLPERYHLK